MTVSLTASVKYLRGVGPHRAAILEERGIMTAGDLLGYLPFRYEDRIRFTKIAEIIPGQVRTILGEVDPRRRRNCSVHARTRRDFSRDCARWLGFAARAIFSRRISARAAEGKAAARAPRKSGS